MSNVHQIFTKKTAVALVGHYERTCSALEQHLRRVIELVKAGKLVQADRLIESGKSVQSDYAEASAEICAKQELLISAFPDAEERVRSATRALGVTMTRFEDVTHTARSVAAAMSAEVRTALK